MTIEEWIPISLGKEVYQKDIENVIRQKMEKDTIGHWKQSEGHIFLKDIASTAAAELFRFSKYLSVSLIAVNMQHILKAGP